MIPWNNFVKYVPNMRFVKYFLSHSPKTNTTGLVWDLKVIQDSGHCAVHVL